MMKKGRLEAFSDGVLAIIITIMVLELRPPHEATLAALRPLLAVFLSYVLSFVNLGIYWNNHHHMIHVTSRVDGAILWANLHLLFWLSLFPAAIAYYILQQTILRKQGPGSLLATAVGRDLKGKLSPLFYAVAIPAAFFQPWIAGALYVTVALIWLVPDPRIERKLHK